MIPTLLYLTAIVAANSTIAHFGPASAILVAFFFIGFDLLMRDHLHERWLDRGLWFRMLALIAAGGALSYAMNADAVSIAVASSAAFILAGIADAATYHALRRTPWMVRSNASNAPAAVVDSVVFVALAFGGFLWPIILGQILAKVAGGLLWSFLLRPWRRNLESHRAS